MQKGWNDFERSKQEFEAALPEDGTMKRKPSKDSDRKLDSQAQALIGQRLRRVYGDLVQEPVPDHLLQLLEELELAEEADHKDKVDE